MIDKNASSFTHFKEFKKHRVYKYCLSIVIVVIATAIQYVAWEYIKPAPFLLFYPAVIFGAFYGDGITAIILSCLAGQYFFVDPAFSFSMHWPHDYIRMAMFLLAAFLIRKFVRNQTESKLKAQSIAELLNEEKETREKFVSTLTHDLQTPLTSAKLQVQLLIRKEKDSEITFQSLKKIERNIFRIEDMIRDLLDANLLRAGKALPINIQECNLKEVIEQSVHELTIIHGDRFRIRNAKSISGYWSCEALMRIIENLCTNAVKYGDPDSKIEICGEEASEGVLLSVNNRGPLIPLEFQQTVFKPFQRAKSAISSSQKGWGLGLALVKGLTDSHGGSIKLLSTEEHGTTFIIYLPYDSRKHYSTLA